MNLIVIHNDPVPPSMQGNRAGNNRIYPYDKLDVGQCFYVPFGGRTPAKVQSILSATSRLYAKKFGGKFLTRIVKEKNAIGVWRVA